MRNKKIYIATAFLFFAFGLFAQDQQMQQLRRAYQLGLKYNDYNAAKNALYNMLAVNPQNDSVLYALAYLYFDSQQYASSILVNMDVLKIDPGNLGSIEMSAIAYENLGLRQKALDNYEKLYLNNSDLNALYKMSFLQYELKKLEEAKTNADILLSKKEIEDEKLVFSFDNKTQQEFPMKVSILNLKGMILRDQGNTDEARSNFTAALELAPDFKPAKDNLEALSK